MHDLEIILSLELLRSLLSTSTDKKERLEVSFLLSSVEDLFQAGAPVEAGTIFVLCMPF